jgi:PAS domain S-box-containing protein
MPSTTLERVGGILARSPIPLTFADLAARDQPLILVNAPFCSLSGYAEEELLGRNCRFLQGDEENTQARADIRLALSRGEDLQVVLRNVRKDGLRFDNLLFLFAMRTEDGPPRYALGSQFELKRLETVVQGAVFHAERLETELDRIAEAADRIRLRQRRHVAEVTATLVRSWMTRSA